MKKHVTHFVLTFLVAAFLFSGCGKKMVHTDSSGYWKKPPQAERARAGIDYSTDEAVAETTEAPVAEDQKTLMPPSERMIHYDGYAKLKVVKPTETIDKAVDIVIGSGGYVEKRREQNASFRIPVKKFNSIFKEVLTLGIVLKKSVSAEDVTDQYTDVGLRLQVAKKSLKRYMELLAKSQDEEEKIRLLKEISRLNEEVEYLENSSKLLSLLADYSRLNIETVPYEQVTSRMKLKDIQSFAWINSLTPFDNSVAEEGEKISFGVPDKLVEIKGDIWKAESADGTIFRAYRRKNNPQGDTTFWISTGRVRLAKEFASAELRQAGTYQYLRLVSLSEKPYIYYVGLRAADNDLNVFEVYFPDAEQEKIYSEAIVRVIKESGN